MAMLAEPRRKQKYSTDPRGLNWVNDNDKFGQKMLEKMGWEKGKGLGANEDGSTDHVKVNVKNNTRGVGCTVKHADNWIAHQDHFDSLLTQLKNEHSDDGPEAVAVPEVQSLASKSKNSRARVHYNKFTKGKDLSTCKNDDLDCILGKRKNTNTPSITPLSQSEANSEVEDSDSEKPEDVSHGVKTFTSNTSVGDYFAQKLAERKLLNQAYCKDLGSEKSNMEESIEPPVCDYIDRPTESEYDEDLKPKKKKRSNTTVEPESRDANTTPRDGFGENKTRKTKKQKKHVLSNSDDHAEAAGISTMADGDQVCRKKKKKKRHEKEVTTTGDQSQVPCGLAEDGCDVPRKKKKKNRREEVLISDQAEAPGIDTLTEYNCHKDVKRKKKKQKRLERETLGNNDAHGQASNTVTQESSEFQDVLAIEILPKKKRSNKNNSDSTCKASLKSNDDVTKPKNSRKTKVEKQISEGEIVSPTECGIVSSTQLAENKQELSRKKKKKHRKSFDDGDIETNKLQEEIDRKLDSRRKKKKIDNSLKTADHLSDVIVPANDAEIGESSTDTLIAKRGTKKNSNIIADSAVIMNEHITKEEKEHGFGGSNLGSVVGYANGMALKRKKDNVNPEKEN